MVNTKETIPNPFDFAQGSAALEAAALPCYQIKFDRLLKANTTIFMLCSELNEANQTRFVNIWSKVYEQVYLEPIRITARYHLSC